MLPPCLPSAVTSTDPLEQCKITVNSKVMYRVSETYAPIEGSTLDQSRSKWSNNKPNFGHVTLVRCGKTLCVDEEGMVVILKTMKETENKQLALRLRGLVDTTDTTPRVREIVLHAGKHPVRIVVSCCFPV